MFNIIQTEKNVETRRVRRLDIGRIKTNLSHLTGLESAPEFDVFNTNVNKTRSILNWYFDDLKGIGWLTQIGKARIPRGLRLMDKRSLLSFILGQDTRTSSGTSCQTTAPALAETSRFISNLARIAVSNRRFSSIKDVSALGTLYACTFFKNVTYVRGTW